MAKSAKFSVQDLSDGAAVFAGKEHIVSTPSRTAAQGIARLLNEATTVQAPPRQLVWALAKSLGLKIDIAA